MAKDKEQRLREQRERIEWLEPFFRKIESELIAARAAGTEQAAAMAAYRGQEFCRFIWKECGLDTDRRCRTPKPFLRWPAHYQGDLMDKLFRYGPAYHLSKTWRDIEMHLGWIGIKLVKHDA
jgi:hypothetical protein